MTLVAIRIIDSTGRKPLLLAGLVGMVISLTVLGLSTLLLSEPSSPTDTVAIITLLCLAGFIISFAATWGPTVWVMLPEVLPLRIRGTAMGVAIFLHWIANFIVSQTFPSLLAAVGPGITFLGYAVIGVLAFFFVSAFVTETKGRSLEQIEADLQQKARFASGGPRRAQAAAPNRYEERRRSLTQSTFTVLAPHPKLVKLGVTELSMSAHPSHGRRRSSRNCRVRAR